MGLQSSWTPEQEHLDRLLIKCHAETNPEKLYCHLQAVKTFLLAHLIQQSTLMRQIEAGQVVEGELEDRLVAECSSCVGETHKVMATLHSLLRRFEDSNKLNSMEFRVESSRLLSLFDRSLSRFRTWFEHFAAQDKVV